MQTAVRRAACVVVLAGPFALAFFAGGYFDEPRSYAGIVVWLVAALAALVVPRPISSSWAVRVALASLAGLAVWTLLSVIWAPLAGAAYQAAQRIVLYAGALFAASVLLRDRACMRAGEPAVGLGALIVVGYGLSERFLPGVLHFTRSASALGRLEQPLTYWNAMGEMAALGLVVCLRIAGDGTRRRGLRTFATGASVPLGVGLYVSFSRGALFACAAGVIALIVVAPSREQWKSGAVALVAAAVAAALAAPFGAITSMAGSLATREREGAIALGLLAATVAVAAGIQWWMIGREVPRPITLPRWAPATAVIVVCLGLGLAIAVGAKEHSTQSLSGGAARLTSLQSNRYAYWRVAFRAFAAEPLHGVGAGGWSVYWLRYRTVNEFAHDAHSLPLQTLAELGLVGLALLLALIAAVAVAAVQVHRRAPALAAGPIAGAVTYLAHSPLDWDWEMPAVTLAALILVGALLALAEPAPAQADAPAPAEPAPASADAAA